MAKKKNKSQMLYPSKYPSKVSRSLPLAEWRKQRTLELYSYLPQTSLEERYKYTDIRDEIIHINYGFFSYVATHVYIKTKGVTYEDKLQSTLSAFCSMWHKYMYAAKYRTDLSFSVFFKPRLQECVYRELKTIKHTVDRSLKMEAADQLDIHYSKLTYDDLSNVNLKPQKMEALKAVFYADFEEDLDSASLFVPVSGDTAIIDEELYSDDYDDIEHVLIKEMIDRERLLTIDDLIDIANTLCLPIDELKRKQPAAEEQLYNNLKTMSECRKSFSDYF